MVIKGFVEITTENTTENTDNCLNNSNSNRQALAGLRCEIEEEEDSI